MGNGCAWQRGVLGRPAVKRQAILAELTRRIVGGSWHAGSRIPTQAQLELEFDAGNPTIQDVMDRLCAAGFLEARGSRGTFVVAHPPHEVDFALVFPGHPYGDGYWSRFWTALEQAAHRLASGAGKGWRFHSYYDINGHVDTEDYGQLQARLASRALGGLIFANQPVELLDSPLLSTPGVPQVALSAGWQPGMPEVMTCYPELSSFMERAVAHLTSPAGGQRRRLAALAFGLSEARVAEWVQVTHRHGASTQPWLIQNPDPYKPVAIHNAVNVLLNQPPAQRPDGFVIADDHLVEEATRALAAAGVRMPQDMTVVAYTNFPAVPPACVPVTRLGFDAVALLTQCIATLSAARRGGPVARERFLPAVFEHELSAMTVPPETISVAV